MEQFMLIWKYSWREVPRESHLEIPVGSRKKDVAVKPGKEKGRKIWRGSSSGVVTLIHHTTLPSVLSKAKQFGEHIRSNRCRALDKLFKNTVCRLFEFYLQLLTYLDQCFSRIFAFWKLACQMQPWRQLRIQIPIGLSSSKYCNAIFCR